MSPEQKGGFNLLMPIFLGRKRTSLELVPFLFKINSLRKDSSILASLYNVLQLCPYLPKYFYTHFYVMVFLAWKVFHFITLGFSQNTQSCKLIIVTVIRCNLDYIKSLLFLMSNNISTI